MENNKSLPHHDERPSSLQIQISQAVLSNCRVGAKCSQTDILNDLQGFISSRLYADMSVFPNGNDDLPPHSNAAWLNDYSINHHQLQNLTKRDRTLYSRLKRDKNLPHQIWCFWCDQIWVEFSGVEKACERPLSFIDAFPLRIWICSDVPYYEASTAFPSVSTLSSDSVEVAEVATEFDECQDIKYSKMNVVYDVNIGRVNHELKESTTLPNHRLIPSDSSTASASSSPGPRRKSLNTKPIDTAIFRESQAFSPKNETRSNILLNKNALSDANSLRTSLSENDLSPSVGQQHQSENSGAQNLVDARIVSNYACGGPPPPYSDDVCDEKNKENSNTSFSSLPPAYDTLPENAETMNKPMINDFVQYDLDSSDLQRNASVSLLMHTSKNVQVQLDHFQLLFLIRLAENISAMMEKIEGDNEKASRERRISLNQLNPCVNEAPNGLGVVLNMMIPNIIIDLVLPPCIGIDPIQTYNLVDRVCYEKEKSENTSVDIQPDVDTLDSLPIISSCETAESIIEDKCFVKEVKSLTEKEVNEDIMPGQYFSEESNIEILNEDKSYPCSGSESLYIEQSNLGDDISNNSVAIESSEVEIIISPIDTANNSKEIHIISEPNSNPHDYKQPSSITEFTENPTAPDLFSNNIDNELDCVSSQDHNPISFDQTLKEVADIGIQVGNSMMNVNLKPRPEDQLISVLRIRVGCLFIGVEAEGKDSLVKVSAESLQLNELGNMKYGKILDPRGIIGGTEHLQEKRQINMDTLTGNAVLKLRLGTGSYADELLEGSSDTGFADIRINALAAALLMSSIDNLQEFGEDELVSLGLPFIVNVTCSDITIYDDKPRRYKSAVKLPPSHIIIDEMYIERGKDGVTTIKERLNKSKGCRDNAESDGDIPQIGSYSATLNGNLIAESINQQVDALIGENSRLLEDLKVVNAKMNGLHSERDSLLKVIDKLQQELVFSNRENDDLHNRIRSLSLSRHQGHYV